ncbi:MAG: mechanosensitive ion channel [Comamonadaceae bacterium]|nr:MAG: mechanosensitive ion channel [Comamonadaceae bacterium]
MPHLERGGATGRGLRLLLSSHLFQEKDLSSVDLSLLSDWEPWAQTAFGLAALALLAMLARALTLSVLCRMFDHLRDSAQTRWLQVLLDSKVLRRVAQIAPSVVVQAGIGSVPHLPASAAEVIRNVAVALTVLHAVRALNALLDAALAQQQREEAAQQPTGRSIKSYVQLGKLLLALVGAIVIVAALVDRSPLLLLSGLGAMSAVLMLVFKDTILSFTAGLLLSTNDMLRVGDWIEMPQVGADGFVIDIALHTVKIQNWDKTITTVPTWRLMSESYRNWRGMFGSGGRRIKRTLRLDTASIRFLEPDDMNRLSRIALLQPYMEGKRREVSETNAAVHARLGPQAAEPANQRRLTNIGTFRAYVDAYLRAHPGIHQDMTLMVRTMEPTPEGAPVELYCFTATTAWVEYEAIQGDVFDHLLAILPEFGLRAYQSPSGSDIRLGLQGLKGGLTVAP